MERNQQQEDDLQETDAFAYINPMDSFQRSSVYVKMSSKHLAAGSPYPPLQPGVLRCYSMKYCPFAQRTRLVLAAKNIEYETVNINLSSKPSWFLDRNPLGKVPMLELDGKTIYESAITCDYLDELYPEPSLYPEDPWEKARERVFVELWSKVFTPLYKIYFAKGDAQVIAKAWEDLLTGLMIFETELARRGTKYFGGDRPGMLDYMIWPHSERIPMLPRLAGDSYSFPDDQFPKIVSWMASMKQDEAVKECYMTPEKHYDFAVGFATGSPDYDA